MDNKFKEFIDTNKDDIVALENSEDWLEKNPHGITKKEIKERLEYVRSLISKLF